MNKKKKAKFHSQLESIRIELIGGVDKLNQSVKESESGHIADISDDASRAYNRQLEGELGEQEWKRLKQVDLAIKKINHGKYGVCTQCESIIPEARLNIVPYTEYCTLCLSEMEKKIKILSSNDQAPFEEN